MALSKAVSFEPVVPAETLKACALIGSNQKEMLDQAVVSLLTWETVAQKRPD